MGIRMKIHAFLCLELVVALCHPLNSSSTLLSLRSPLYITKAAK